MADVVTFDPANLLIIEIGTGGDNTIDVVEMYSEWKEWVQVGNNAGYPPALRYVGGDPISDVQNLGSTFFITNGWRFRPAEQDHRITLVGNLYTDPAGDSVFVPTLGDYTVLAEMVVSNLVDSSVARLDLAALQEYVFIDTLNGSASGAGTPTDPVDSIAAAYQVAVAQHLRGYSLVGSVTLDRTYNDWKMVGTVGPESATINLGGHDVDEVAFDHVTITGTGSGDVHCHRVVVDNVAGLGGSWNHCGLAQYITPGSGELVVLCDCFSILVNGIDPVVDLVALGTTDLIMRRYSGNVELRNVDQAAENVSVDMMGKLELASSCTAGSIVARGQGLLADNSAGSTVDVEGFLSVPDVAMSRKLGTNKAVITNEGDGSQTVRIYDDDGTTVLHTFTVDVAREQRVPA